MHGGRVDANDYRLISSAQHSCRRTMLYLSVYEFFLVRPRRTSSVEEKGLRFGIFRRLWTPVGFDTVKTDTPLKFVSQHRPVRSTTDDQTVTKMLSPERIIGDGSASVNSISIVRPRSEANAYGGLEIARESGYIVMVDGNVCVIAIIRLVIDQIDSCENK